MRSKPILALLATVAVAACGPWMKPLVPAMDNGEMLSPRGDEVVARARAEGEVAREALREERAAAMAAALESCDPEACEAVARGELALGMTEAQVLAATGTTAHAWEVRRSGRVTTMAPLPGSREPSDREAGIALVHLQDGAVRSYTYREPQGMRTVASPADATLQGRANARAEVLLREGDDYASAGRLDLALERYDQADILRPDHPQTTLRIARTLDKALRPVEAVVRYRLFIHQLELERLRAEGEVAASIAEAIARAHERIVVLERR